MIEKPKGKPKHNSLGEDGCTKWMRLFGLVALPIAICYLLGILRGIFAILSVFISTALPPQAISSCEIQISDTNIFRTQVMSQGLKPSVLTYEITQDGGNTWDSFYEVLSDSGGLRTNCDSFHAESAAFYWVVPDEGYYPTKLFITHDSGETWHEWTPSNVSELAGNCTIQEVNFYRNNGSMLVECSIYHSSRRYEESQSYNLFSEDGGLTWNIAND